MANQRACATCRHWCRRPDGEGYQGECRRNAPAAHVTQGTDNTPPAARWPITLLNEWCGEWGPDEDAALLASPVSALELSMRPRHVLSRVGVATVAQLIDCTAAELLRRPNFGETSLAEVRRALAARGLALKGEGVPA